VFLAKVALQFFGWSCATFRFRPVVCCCKSRFFMTNS